MTLVRSATPAIVAARMAKNANRELSRHGCPQWTLLAGNPFPKTLPWSQASIKWRSILIGPSEKAVGLWLPPLLAERLSDWSTPEAMDGAAKAVVHASRAYALAAADMPGASASKASEGAAIILESIQSDLREARSELDGASLFSQARVDEPERRRFYALRSLMGPNPSFAGKSGLRSSLAHLPRQMAFALMRESDVRFSISQPWGAFERNPPNEDCEYVFRVERLGGLNQSAAPVASATALGLSRALEGHPGLDSVKARLTGPDGELRGGDDIRLWRADVERQCAAWAAFELASETPEARGVQPRRRVAL